MSNPSNLFYLFVCSGVGIIDLWKNYGRIDWRVWLYPFKKKRKKNISNLPRTSQDKLFDLMKNYFWDPMKNSFSGPAKSFASVAYTSPRQNVLLKRTPRVLVICDFSYCSGGKIDLMRNTSYDRPYTYEQEPAMAVVGQGKRTDENSDLRSHTSDTSLSLSFRFSVPVARLYISFATKLRIGVYSRFTIIG